MDKLILLCLVAVALLTACHKQNDSQEVDVTGNVFAKLASRTYTMRKSTFQMTAAGKFKFHYDADVTVLDSSTAHCVYDLSGNVTFLNSQKMRLEIKDVELVDTLPESNHALTCSDYAGVLKSAPITEQTVFDVQSNFLAFSGFNIELRKNDNRVAFSELHHDQRDFVYAEELLIPNQWLGVDTRYRYYFVAPDRKLDMTNSLLPLIKGKYAMTQDGQPDLDLTLDASLKRLTYTSSTCALQYSYDINSISVDSDGIQVLSLTAAGTNAQPPANIEICNLWNKYLLSLPINRPGIGIVMYGYEPYGVKFLFLTMPHDPGSDYMESFEAIK
jgi:hypothetical protein